MNRLLGDSAYRFTGCDCQGQSSEKLVQSAGLSYFHLPSSDNSPTPLTSLHIGFFIHQKRLDGDIILKPLYTS